MKLVFALTFLWTLLSSAGALQCLTCTDATDPTCASTASFPCATSECVTATLQAPSIIKKGCASSTVCPAAGNQTFSVSSTTSNYSVNALCCNTDNCNVATLSSPTFQSVNSLQCYSCDNINFNCSVRIQCTGAQNRCFKANETVGGVTFPVLGCASANLCTPGFDPSSIFPLPGLSSLSCCQGSLCNSAPAVATTAHLLLALLVFSLYQD